jgi:hypothetical protein
VLAGAGADDEDVELRKEKERVESWGYRVSAIVVER